MKKFILGILLGLTSLFCAFGFASCILGGDNEENNFVLVVDKTEAEYGETVTLTVPDTSLMGQGLYYYAKFPDGTRQYFAWGKNTVSFVIKQDTTFYVEYTYHDSYSVEVSVKVKPVNGISLTADQTEVNYGDTITLNAITLPGGVSYCINYYALIDGTEKKLDSNTYVMDVPSVTFYAKHENGKESERITAKVKVNEIANATELNALENASYILKNNIDLGGEVWSPIADFAGVLDGNGYTISNFTLSENADNLGFFSVLNGTVKNVDFENVTLNMRGDKSNAGVIAGRNYGTIENCTVKGCVTAKYAKQVGGIVGYNEASGIIKNCKNYAEIEANDFTGGVCGISQGTLENLENHADVSGKSHIGGVCGKLIGGINKNLTNKADITAEGDEIGGVVGVIADSELTQIESNGNVSTDGRWAGGLIGRVYTPNISEFTHTGSVSGLDSVGGYFGALEVAVSVVGYENDDEISGTTSVGGIVGWAHDSTAIMGCTNNGTVTGDCYLGGIIGGGSATLTECENTGAIENKNGKLADNLLCSYTGGIAGQCKGLEYCTNIIPITGVGAYVGGFAGYASGDVKGCENSVEVVGTKYVGGICGYNGGTLSLSNNTASITGTEFVGGGIGYGSSVSDFVNDGAVTGVKYVGGILGGQNGGKAELCENNAEINGTEYVGGCIGHSDRGTVSVAENNANITGSGNLISQNNLGDYVGGIVAYIKYGSVTGATNNASVTGFNKVGGIVGASDGSAIRDSENHGAVSGEVSIGGIAGLGWSEHHTYMGQYGSMQTGNYFASNIEHCENTGEINGYSHIGGIVGKLDSTNTATSYNRVEITVTVKNCTNSGTVTARASSVAGIVGGAYGHCVYVNNDHYVHDPNIVYIQVDNCTNTGTISGSEYTSGILGYKGNTYVKDPTNCTDNAE